MNPSKCPPSIFNLVKRVRSGACLPFINQVAALVERFCRGRVQIRRLEAGQASCET